MPIPPPAKQLVLSLLVERLRLRVPLGAFVAVLLVLVPSGAWLALGDARGAPPVGPLPAPVPQVPLQQWAAGVTGAPGMVTAAILNALPPPDTARQKRPPCAVKVGERAYNGYCWLELAVRPPCPKDPDAYAFEHDGACFAYALKEPRHPTTGEPRAAPVAAPGE